MSNLNEGSKVSRKLPRNWYKNNDLLGFAVYSIHAPTDKEPEDGIDDSTWSLNCKLTTEDGHEFKDVDLFSCQSWCYCGDEDEDEDEDEDANEEDEDEDEDDDDEDKDEDENENDDDDEDNDEDEDEDEDDEDEEEDENDDDDEDHDEDEDEDEDENDDDDKDEDEDDEDGDEDDDYDDDDYDDDDVSSQVWVFYCPLVTGPSRYTFNKRRVLLKAEFQGHFQDRPVKVEKCGIHFIYAHEQDP